MRVFLLSLGCPKNLVDSEVMVGLLCSQGYIVVSEPREAEIIICNTCAFIQDAAQESVDRVLELASHKKEGKCRRLLVAGCLAQRYGKELLEEMPEVDAVLGTGEFARIGEVCERALRGERVFQVAEPKYLYDHLVPRVLATPIHYAYLKIAEGCDNQCSYCVIPDLRGSYRSRALDSCVEEARALARRGVKELILTAQDTTGYGVDLYGHAKTADLLRAVTQVEGIQWVRLLYAHPRGFTDELIRAIAEEEKVCNYLDLPIQHISNRILKAMRRKVTRGDIASLIGKLRASIPELVLRTSLIVGFPGEGEEDFQELLDFVAEVKFERLGVFRYSREAGTSVAAKAQVPDEIKHERWARVMELQRQVCYERNVSMIGRTVEVLVDERMAEDETSGDFLHRGRTAADAPEIDCSVFVQGEGVEVGELAEVRIVRADDFDLYGGVVDSGRRGRPLRRGTRSG